MHSHYRDICFRGVSPNHPQCSLSFPFPFFAGSVRRFLRHSVCRVWAEQNYWTKPLHIRGTLSGNEAGGKVANICRVCKTNSSHRLCKQMKNHNAWITAYVMICSRYPPYPGNFSENRVQRCTLSWCLLLLCSAQWITWPRKSHDRNRKQPIYRLYPGSFVCLFVSLLNV